VRIAALRNAYVDACRCELRALKPGNVHILGEGHNMTVEDFERSAAASAEPLSHPGRTVGSRVFEAARATHKAVGCNTNLGILLLSAPLLAAAEIAARGELHQAIEATLDRLTVEDAVQVYDAIRIARPAGLGTAPEQDIAKAPSIDLRRVMTLAAERDRIARQYATGFADVFDIGVCGLAEAQRADAGREWATAHVYLSFLAAFPDSHIARKFGQERAEEVRREAARLRAAAGSAHELEEHAASLVEFDRSLKARGLNPGTSADLTVASLLAHAIADILSTAAA
jgi:triphosphoribosyl-dephospho-CoA synthase